MPAGDVAEQQTPVATLGMQGGHWQLREEGAGAGDEGATLQVAGEEDGGAGAQRCLKGKPTPGDTRRAMRLLAFSSGAPSKARTSAGSSQSSQVQRSALSFQVTQRRLARVS